MKKIPYLRWSKGEKKLLALHYGKTENWRLQREHFPYRSLKSIQQQACTIGVTTPTPNWTDAEKAKLACGNRPGTRTGLACRLKKHYTKKGDQKNE